jgi:hypothetical protein
LHEAQGERSAAAHYYALNLARLDAEGASGADATEALLYLAEYAKVCWQSGGGAVKGGGWLDAEGAPGVDAMEALL